MNPFSTNTCQSIANTNIQGNQLFDTLSFGLLTVGEENHINEQFQGHTWHHNQQVIWSGIQPTIVQLWADKRNMQTLTTAMGPLRIPKDPRCLKKENSQEEWSRYMKGASAIFAWHIIKGEKVTMLSPPPPERFNPCGLTNYQLIEEPILKTERSGRAALRIYMVHPDVEGAEDFYYQIWPTDETHIWTEKFGMQHTRLQMWRTVTLNKDVIRVLEVSEARIIDSLSYFLTHNLEAWASESMQYARTM
jgi:hypothetical protein